MNTMWFDLPLRRVPALLLLQREFVAQWHAHRQWCDAENADERVPDVPQTPYYDADACVTRTRK